MAWSLLGALKYIPHLWAVHKILGRWSQNILKNIHYTTRHFSNQDLLRARLHETYNIYIKDSWKHYCVTKLQEWRFRTSRLHPWKTFITTKVSKSRGHIYIHLCFVTTEYNQVVYYCTNIVTRYLYYCGIELKYEIPSTDVE